MPGEVVVRYEARRRRARAARRSWRRTPARASRRRSRAARRAARPQRDAERHRPHRARAQRPGPRDTAAGWQALQWNFAGPFGVNAPAAWDNVAAAGHPGGSDVVVAVLDTGVAYATRGRFLRSPDLDPASFVPGKDFVDRDRFPNDLNGHGTHVTSTIAERVDNGVGVTGLAYGATDHARARARPQRRGRLRRRSPRASAGRPGTAPT